MPKATKKNHSKSSTSEHKCEEGKIHNDKTNRCVDANGKAGRAIASDKQKGLIEPKINNHRMQPYSKKTIKKTSSNEPSVISNINELFNTISTFPKSKKCSGDASVIMRMLSYVYATLPHAKFCVPKTKLYNLKDLTATVAISFDQKCNLESAQIPPNLQDSIFKCPETFVVLYMLLTFEGDESHANLLFIDKTNKTFERFEPHGQLGGCGHTKIDKYLKYIFGPENLSDDFIYIAPLDVCPMLGPQSKQAKNKDCIDNGGYCATFVTLYAHMRVIEPDATPASVIERLLELSDEEILTLILKYISYINSIVPAIGTSNLQKFDNLYMKY